MPPTPPDSGLHSAACLEHPAKLPEVIATARTSQPNYYLAVVAELSRRIDTDLDPQDQATVDAHAHTHARSADPTGGKRAEYLRLAIGSLDLILAEAPQGLSVPPESPPDFGLDPHGGQRALLEANMIMLDGLVQTYRPDHPVLARLRGTVDAGGGRGQGTGADMMVHCLRMAQELSVQLGRAARCPPQDADTVVEHTRQVLAYRWLCAQNERRRALVETLNAPGAREVAAQGDPRYDTALNELVQLIPDWLALIRI